MNYMHYLYPLLPLERLSAPSRSLNIPKELRRTLSEQRLKPQRDWEKYRLWPKESIFKQNDDGSYVFVSGLFQETKHEIALAQKAEWKHYQEQVNSELVIAKESCKCMTIQQAWKILQGYLCTNEYEVERMSNADYYTYSYAKELLDNHIKSL